MAVSISLPPAVTIATEGIQGRPGTPGTNGADGASAYDIWISLGNTGTPQDFINSLKGPKGDKGDPGTGGGGGVVPVWYIADLNAGIIHLPGPTASWTPVAGNGVTIAHDILDVATGDVIEMDISFLRIGASMQLDCRFVLAGAPVRYFSAMSDLPAAPGPEGEPMWYSGTSFKNSTATRAFLVDPSWGVTAGSTVRVEMVYQGNDIPADGSHTLYWGNGYPGHFDGKHWKIGPR